MEYAGAACLALLLLLVAWQLVGRGSRRRRCYRHCRRWLQRGDWQQALLLLRPQQQGRGQPPAWQERWLQLEAECHQAALVQALEVKDFEKALEHGLRAATLLQQPESEARNKVIEAMLEEVRRLFAASQGPDTAAVMPMITRVFLLQSSCPEASFWQGLCHLREGQPAKASACFHTARTETEPQVPKGLTGAAIDPSLYLGGLLLRQRQYKEALTFLTEAKRIDGNSPFVLWQLGAALIGAGGDTRLALRALHRALGPQGLEQWLDRPARAWLEGLPQQRSYVRRLASHHAFVCPLWGSDLAQIIRHGKVALGQGHYRLGQFQEAARLFDQLLQESAPSLEILRGLGLSLARLGQYDQAFKHLRAAHELEEPKERFTAGFLALCGAKGKPSKEADKARNVAWAIRMVTRFEGSGDEEWIALVSAIFAEARTLNLPVAAADQLYLCDHLASIFATDQQAAEAYHHLAASFPDAICSEHAWLFCRAAQQHGFSGPCTLDLFARTFAEAPAARQFFAQKQWDFEAIEITYLERAAEWAPGAFPSALGPDYAARGQDLLCLRSRQQEQAQQLDAALITAATWIKLAPQSGSAHERLANLYYQSGQLERSLELLHSWQALEPANFWPFLRAAIIHHLKEETTTGLDNLRLALERTTGRHRGEIAFLGARMALQQALRLAPGESAPPADFDHSALAQARSLLEECLRCLPDHVGAQWCLAGVRWLADDRAALVAQAVNFSNNQIHDARYFFLAGVCHLAGRNYSQVEEACQRVIDLVQKERNRGPVEADQKTTKFDLAVESSFLSGLTALAQGQSAAAQEHFRSVAARADSPSRSLAHAFLGQLSLAQKADEEAIRWWQALDAQKRTSWNLAEALAGTVFLNALQALAAGRFEEAANKIREAGRLGWRDRRLGQLLTLALFKAGQQRLYNEV